jgi:Domain of unknown function (DUF4410)
MRVLHFVPLFFLLATAALFSPKPKLVAGFASPADGPTVYVSDFELDVFTGGPRPSPESRAASTPRTASPNRSSNAPGPRNTPSGASPNKPAARPTADSQNDDNPTERANELVNAVAENIVSALEKAGYKAQRLRADEPLPVKGLRIRGVFAEADEKNRARRLLVGSGSGTSRMILYVGVNNLGKAEQPLYEIANPPSNESGYGPVITVTSYTPAVRFDLPKEPAVEEIKKVATQIAADLSALLNANPLLTAE